VGVHLKSSAVGVHLRSSVVGVDLRSSGLVVTLVILVVQILRSGRNASFVVYLRSSPGRPLALHVPHQRHLKK
jgi:hypothetical protein